MPTDGPVGPITFSVPEAREQLESEGEVVTFRKDERTTGETWWRESRTGPKCGDVTVEYLDPADPMWGMTLEPYWERSGFRSVQSWAEAILDLHGDPGEGHLYRVTVIGGDDAE